MSNVTHIGEWVIQQKGKRWIPAKDECSHRHLTMDDEGDIVKCDDCGIQVSAYWALRRMISECERFITKVRAERASVEKARQESLHLIAAKKVEKAWRSRSMVPACPHCRAGIFPEDGFGSGFVNKEIELRRREVKRRSTDTKTAAPLEGGES